MDARAHLLALLYAGPGSAVVRASDGRLEVRPASRVRDGGTVELTHEEMLERGVDALLELVA